MNLVISRILFERLLAPLASSYILWKPYTWMHHASFLIEYTAGFITLAASNRVVELQVFLC